MLGNATSLAYILPLAWLVFWLFEPIAARIGRDPELRFRRNMWMGYTVIAFLSPGFWVFVALTTVFLFVNRGKENNPVALFLVLFHAAPNTTVELPRLFGIGLLSIDSYILLGLTVLLPALIGQGSRRVPGRKRPNDPVLYLMVLFVALQIVAVSGTESATQLLRRAVTFALDSVLIYVGFKSLVKTREQFLEALISLTVGLTVMALIAALESAKGWLIYSELAGQWSPYSLSTYISRAGRVRAMGATVHSIVLGTLLAAALPVAMSLRDASAGRERSRVNITLAILFVGLLASLSRAPWLCGAAAVFIYVWLAPGKRGRVGVYLLGLVLLCALALLTPWGATILDLLPFIGSQEEGGITYRQQMNSALWGIFTRDPWSGNPFMLQDLEALRQGQGIIDLLNVYLVMAVAYGGWTLLAFVGILTFTLHRGYHALRTARAAGDRTLACAQAALISAMLSHDLFMASASWIGAVPTLCWILGGLAGSTGSVLVERTPAVKNELQVRRSRLASAL